MSTTKTLLLNMFQHHFGKLLRDVKRLRKTARATSELLEITVPSMECIYRGGPKKKANNIVVGQRHLIPHAPCLDFDVQLVLAILTIPLFFFFLTCNLLQSMRYVFGDVC